MEANSSQAVIEKTKNWVEKTVIGLNLCPFAKAVSLKNQIRYQVTEATETEQLLQDMIRELKYLSSADPALVDTSILIHPQVLTDFLDYNDFLDLAEAALIELNLVSVLQIASFHPQYQFAGTEPEDIENYTNRSPYPMLHFLRESSVEKAIDSYNDAESIPDQNIETLRNLDPEMVKKLKALL